MTHPANDQPVASVAQREQVKSWRILAKGTLAMLFAFIALFVYVEFVRTDPDAHRNAVAACRTKYAFDVSIAQVDNDLAFNQLLVAISDPTLRSRGPGALDDELAAIQTTGNALKVAIDVRKGFEANPTTECGG